MANSKLFVWLILIYATINLLKLVLYIIAGYLYDENFEGKFSWVSAEELTAPAEVGLMSLLARHSVFAFLIYLLIIRPLNFFYQRTVQFLICNCEPVNRPGYFYRSVFQTAKSINFMNAFVDILGLFIFFGFGAISIFKWIGFEGDHNTVVTKQNALILGYIFMIIGGTHFADLVTSHLRVRKLTELDLFDRASSDLNSFLPNK